MLNAVAHIDFYELFMVIDWVGELRSIKGSMGLKILNN